MKINSLLQKTLPVLAAILVFANLLACDNRLENKSESVAGKTQSHILTVSQQTMVSHLYYNGNIQPLHTINIMSPVAGVVEKVLANYGDWVQIKQPLLLLRSSKSQQDYTAALINYLKNKDQYLRDKNSFDATSALYKTGIVDKETYLRDKSQLETNRLAYLTAASAMRSLNQNILKEHEDFAKLTLENMATLEETLTKPYHKFTFSAPITGILLAPEKNQANSAGNDQALAEGSEVKENQILLTIGDMTGIATTIDVNEADINKISSGQMVVLTSSALPGLVLQGRVSRVARQTKDSSSQDLASFPVHIEIPGISQTQRQLLRIGMSAKIDIEIRQPAQIKIPIKAVFAKDGVDKVRVIDTENGKIREVTVATGETDASQVIVSKGLSLGQRILVND